MSVTWTESQHPAHRGAGSVQPCSASQATCHPPPPPPHFSRSLRVFREHRAAGVDAASSGCGWVQRTPRSASRAPCSPRPRTRSCLFIRCVWESSKHPLEVFARSVWLTSPALSRWEQEGMFVLTLESGSSFPFVHWCPDLISFPAVSQGPSVSVGFWESGKSERVLPALTVVAEDCTSTSENRSTRSAGDGRGLSLSFKSDAHQSPLTPGFRGAAAVPLLPQNVEITGGFATS